MTKLSETTHGAEVTGMFFHNEFSDRVLAVALATQTGEEERIVAPIT